MDSLIKANHLDHDEFLVECAIRKITGSFDSKLVVLQEAFTNEKQGIFREPIEVHEAASKNPIKELNLCESKLKNFSGFVKEFITKNSTDFELLEQYYSRTLHVRGRIFRVSSYFNDNKISHLLNDCNKLLKSMHKILRKSTDTADNAEPNDTDVLLDVNLPDQDPPLEKDEPNSAPQPGCSKDMQPKRNSKLSASRESDLKSEIIKLQAKITSLENRNRSFAKTRLKSRSETYSSNDSDSSEYLSDTSSLLISHKNSDPNRLIFGQINIKFYFDGTSKGLTIDDFLFRVERLAKLYSIPSSQLIDELNFVLRDEASIWYWSYLKKTNCTRWSNLKRDFLDYFDDNADERILRYIENRKQRSREPFSDFYKDVRSRVLRLKKVLNDKDLIRILFKNMRPSLSCTLVGKEFKSVRKLVHKCSSIEEHWNKHGYFPDVLCNQKRSVNEICETEVTDDPISQSKVNAIQYPKIDINKNLLCWNCLGNHRHKDCTEPIKPITCFGCGKSVPLKPYCQDCVAENPKPSAGITGNPGNSESSGPRKQTLCQTKKPPYA